MGTPSCLGYTEKALKGYHCGYQRGHADGDEGQAKIVMQKE
jgi:hypothetical protein